MNPFLDAIGAACKAANAILSAIPALIWAIALALTVGYAGVVRHELGAAVEAKDEAIGAKRQIEAQLEQQKKDARALLAQRTAERDALQAQLNEAHRAQEIKDANNRALIDDQARRLRALAAASAGGLRDPNAAGCRGDSRGPESVAAAHSGGREEHAPEAGGLLSTPLSGLLLELTREADDINAAYESARADAMMCRGAMP